MSAPEGRRYHGMPRVNASGLVSLRDPDELVRPLPHRAHHSPDGFAWGYGGSGPADLARSLLWDVVGAEPEPAVYQEFKAQVVARWPQGHPWSISAREIRAWLALRNDAPWPVEERSATP